MTLSIQWVMEVAQQLADEQGQGLRVIGVKNVRAAKWIEIEPAQSVSVIANWRDDDYVNVDIIGHLSALVHLSSTPPVHPNVTWAAQSDEQTPPLKAQAIYTSRWMFHGSAYQGIEDLIGISPTGIRGILRNDGVPGALLDNVGQLFGLWVMLTQSEDRVVMPVRLLNVEFFGPPPPIGDLLPCDVQIESVDRREVKANMTLWHNHKVWAVFTGWSDWRFETSGQLWSLMRYPERTLFAHTLMNGKGVTLTLAERISTAASSREFLVGRCLNKKERTEYRALSVHRQRDWLAGRIATKDALRQWAWSRGVGTLFPIEIGVDQAVTDRPPQFDVEALPQALQASYALSITHSDGLALAAMLHPERQNGAIGVDLEKVEHRTQEWREVSFSTNELARLASLSKERYDDALTSWWTIKESAAKCASQLGIVAGLGTPQKWQIDAWHMTNEMPLYEEVEVLSSGTANVRLLDKERYFKVAWWLFRRHQQTWACSLCLGD
jgi:phosphopantetheinyl transferase (holo-ACP synthase)